MDGTCYCDQPFPEAWSQIHYHCYRLLYVDGNRRLVRAETLSLKEREYVMYAKFVGIPGYVIILKHIIPSVLPTIIIAASTGIANAIMTESSLSFLGLGIQQPMSSWGSLLQNVLTIFAFNKLGNLLRIFVEPRVMSGEKD